MSEKVYSLDEIKAIAVPLARQYGLAALYLFGSYARGEATPQSDLDFLIDRSGMEDLLALGGFCSDMEKRFDKPLDVLTTQMLSNEFRAAIQPERVLLYAKKP